MLIINKAIQYLKNIVVFSDLNEEQLYAIHSVSVVKKFEKDEIVFREGDEGLGFHFVKEGRVKIVKGSEDGREHIIKLVRQGDVFAEVLLFNNRPYPATAIAAEDSSIGMIRNIDMEKLVVNDSSLALKLIKTLSSRLLFVQQKIKSLALHDVLARTAEALLLLSAEQNHLSRQELADFVGTSRETVIRMLGSLRKQKIIEFDAKKIIILDAERLAKIASSELRG